MVQPKDVAVGNSGNPQVRLCEIVRASGSCGFNLTKSKWDPYPWVSNVESDSPAEVAGVQTGDCLLEVNGEDVLGLRVVEVANRVKARDEKVTVMLWNSGVDSQCSPETLCCGPMPTNLQRLSSCLSNILAALECPICLDTIPPPAHQCANGHLLCLKCRVKTEKCPVCRLKIFRGRSLLADQVYNSMIEAFDLGDKEESKRRKMLKQRFSQRSSTSKNNKPEIKINLLNVPTNKILSRLIKSGKSSSAENLTESNNLGKNSALLNPSDFHSGLRIKSLSSNEIFRLDSQSASKVSPVLSSRPGSGLLDVQSAIYATRPASYHGSIEELQKTLTNDFGIDSMYQTNLCCPCDAKCKKPFSQSSFFKHVQEYHAGPVLHFLKSTIELVFPLVYESTTVLTVSSYNTIFIIKILDYTCKNEQNRLWIWNLDSRTDFTAKITLQSNTLKMATEFPILSLEKSGWQEIIDENHGILLNVIEQSIKLEIQILSTFCE